MTLIKSISGIRGTIGGEPGDALTPLDLVKFTSAYAEWVRNNSTKKSGKIVVGRDARISGEMVFQIVSGTLMGMGFDVINIGLATTPTTELAVTYTGADGGIILTASHNPKQWNALKLLNEFGEFLDHEQGQKVLKSAAENDYTFSEVDNIGKLINDETMLSRHIDSVLKLNLVNTEAIKNANFTVAIDCVNSVGGIAIPALLKALGVKAVVELYTKPDGHFPHNPEPLPEHLTEISNLLKDGKADVGFVVDPDVDRLAVICENGEMFGEEYTLVAVSDYVLSKTPGNTVSNLSSSRALRDVTEWHGGEYTASAVGEVHVVKAMKDVSAVIGGEGNGGVIYPESHYGRDALVGIALFLSHMAESKLKVSELKKKYPYYYIDKQKVQLEGIDVDSILNAIKVKFAAENLNLVDGIKIDYSDRWVQLRKSNTEPIIRIYSEAPSKAEAEELTNQIRGVIVEIVGV